MQIITTIVDGRTSKSFVSRFITMYGRKYEIVECGRNGRYWYQVVKNERGEKKEYEHNELAKILENEDILSDQIHTS